MVLDRAREALSRAQLPPRARTVCAVLGVLAGLVAAIGVVARYRSPGRGWVLGVSALSPYLMLAGPAALVLFGVARRLLGVAVAVALTAVLVVTQAPLFVGADAPASARPLVVMTANLHLGQADAAGLVAGVRRHRVDVLVLDELTADEVTRLAAAGLDGQLPHRAIRPFGAASGTGIWSRYPLSSVRLRTDFANASVTARVGVPGVSTPPLILALHLAGPYPQATKWQRDVRHLRTVLRALGDSATTIVAGDFNSTLDVAQFRDLLDGYADAAEQAGDGPTPTYPADHWYPALIAIDHVLTRHAVATSAETVDVRGSDHLGLLVTVAVPTR